ncbi:hypothetical protein MHK_006517 [Candidatus Magnetomorum sp. HK-1]|nr:hypothetical protein MHK_006517 [Candidatus Magnetomorum sp. HK-1]
MIYALKERIGNPSIFCGRKREMKMLLNWVERKVLLIILYA